MGGGEARGSGGPLGSVVLREKILPAKWCHWKLWEGPEELEALGRRGPQEWLGRRGLHCWALGPLGWLPPASLGGWWPFL